MHLGLHKVSLCSIRYSTSAYSSNCYLFLPIAAYSEETERACSALKIAGFLAVFS